MNCVAGWGRPGIWALVRRAGPLSAASLVGPRLGRRLVGAWLGFVLMAASGLSAGAAPADYKLGPQDRLRVKVFEWRPSRGEVFEWTALNDEYTIGAGGTVSLPLIGELAAEGLGTDELARAIADTLQTKVGLVQRPDAAVEVVQFRPFYIVGQVEKPGEYPFRPAMTVLQAVSIAGGFPRITDPGQLRLERETITSRGALRILDLDANALAARLARLKTEQAGADSIDFPQPLLASRADPTIGPLLAQEQSIFEMRREALRTQVESLDQLKSFLEKEVESLKGQVEVEDRQLGLVRRELQSVGTLVDKGLAVAPRQLALERTVAQIEGDRLRVATQLLRAKQDISKTELTVLEQRNKFHNDVVVEIRLTQAKIDENTEQTRTAESLAYESEVTAPEFMAQRMRDQKLKPIFTILRRIGDRSIEMTVADNASMEPGDTIRVELPRGERAPLQVGTPPSTTRPQSRAPEGEAPDAKRLSLGQAGTAEN
jgi:protein involved in polysaccharide export with SLBB domain